MKKYLIFYKKFIIIISIFYSFNNNLQADEGSLSHNKENNIYIIGSNLGYELNNSKKYELIKVLKSKYNIINLSKSDISIYDQIDLVDNTFFNQQDKILVLLEKFYLESIFFEQNYLINSCKKNLKNCNNINLISYSDMYIPLIEILHKRLEDFFYNTGKYNNIVFLVDYTDFYYDRYNFDILKQKINTNFFDNKQKYCVLNSINIFDNNTLKCLLDKYE